MLHGVLPKEASSQCLSGGGIFGLHNSSHFHCPASACMHEWVLDRDCLYGIKLEGGGGGYPQPTRNVPCARAGERTWWMPGQRVEEQGT